MDEGKADQASPLPEWLKHPLKETGKHNEVYPFSPGKEENSDLYNCMGEA